ncbi:Ubiquitin carboxyl-terminal hydrolase 5 [Diplonema papillatum]|nr:Ubiquitin carboxyl-terminal hydrolase 5 [Diplonema papillatum]
MEQEASEEQLELSSCLSGFFESDAKLDPIVCDACHQICPHTQSVRAWGLPPLLVIQLKRFTWAADTGGRKIKTAVNFPLTDLDLKPNLAAKVNDPFDDEDDANSKAPSPTLNGAVPKKLTSRENTLYDLYAVVNHEGIRTYGHYYCFVKQSNNSWILLNDSKCVPIAESQVVTEKAYLLFYQRKDIEYASLDDVWAMVPDAQPVDIAGVKRSDSKKKAPSPVFSSAAKTAVIKTAAKPKEKSKETCSDCTVL